MVVLPRNAFRLVPLHISVLVLLLTVTVPFPRGTAASDKDSTIPSLEDTKRKRKDAWHSLCDNRRLEKMPRSEIEKWLEDFEEFTMTYGYTTPTENQWLHDLMRCLRRVAKNDSSLTVFLEPAEIHGRYNIRDALYFGAGYHNFIKGNLNDAARYFRMVKREFKDSFYSSELCEEDLESLEKEAEELRHIDERYPTENPEKLWRIGEVLSRAMRKRWNIEEIGYDTALPRAIFERLIDNYPESPWAALAEYNLLLEKEIGYQEGGDVSRNLELAQEWKEFIRKYPTSEMVARAKMRIAILYYNWELWDGQSSQEVEGTALLDEALGLLREVIGRSTDADLVTEAEKRIAAIEELKKERGHQ